MKNKLVAFLVVFVFLIPLGSVRASSGSEVSITKDGAVSMTNVKVMQIFGSTLATRLYWDDAFIRLTIKTDNKTIFLRGTGEATTLSEIAEGDVLDITGTIDPGNSALAVSASMVKNSSVQKKQTSTSGKVSGIDISSSSFALETKKYGTIHVVATTTTKFLKGSRVLDIGHLKISDTISQTSGDYDLNTKTLIPQTVTIYIDPNFYKPQNFKGKFQEISGNNIKVVIGGVLYLINITDKTGVLSNNKKSTSLSRFVAGDNIILHGTIREVDNPIIDADTVRNMNL